MRLKIIGSGDAFGSGGRINTCVHLTAFNGTSILVDCGASAMVGLSRENIDRKALQALIFTHFHGDHFGGLPFLLLDAMYVQRRTSPLIIAGPKGIAARARAITEAAFPGHWDKPRAFDLVFQELTPQKPVMVAGFEVAAFAVQHEEAAGPCQGYRLSCGGKTFAFSGDTGWTETLIPLAADADLLLVECYAKSLKLSNHLDWDTLIQHLPELTARRTVITHMGPEMLAFDDPLPVKRAYDGMVLSL